MPRLLNFVNNIVKKTLEFEKYNQLGRLPKFFLSTEAQNIPDMNLEMWPGFEIQSKLLNDGIFLNLDTCTKFITTSTIFDEIQDFIYNRYSNEEICAKY